MSNLVCSIPLFPPAAAASTLILSGIAWVSFGRYAFLPTMLSTLVPRIAAIAIVLGITIFLTRMANNELAAAGSGTFFTPVGGLATTGVYKFSRNPMYTGLVFAVLPGFAFLLNTLWPILFAPLLWAYLHLIVIAAEEKLLTNAFGAQYEAYCKDAPRYFLCL